MLSLLLTTRCNFKCAHCLYSCIEEGIDASKEVWVKAIELTSKNDESINLIGGEPTLHPDFEEIVTSAIEICHKTENHVRLVTNGSWILDQNKHKEFERLSYIAEAHRILLLVETYQTVFHKLFLSRSKFQQVERFYRGLRNRYFYGFASSGKNINRRIVPVGRAEKLKISLEREEPLCNQRDCNGVAINPNGDINYCCIPTSPRIGNILTSQREEISRRYDEIDIKIKALNEEHSLSQFSCEHCSEILGN